MLSNFFIDRPVFAWVIAILISAAGMLAFQSLPIAQYPEIAPPQVTVRATYPGASAETLKNTVTQVIEQNLTGIDNLRYFTSISSSSGVSEIILTFETGTDPDIAQVQTQNKLSQALPQLPSQAQELGISVTKSSGTFLLVAGFYSEKGELDQVKISDYVSSNIVEPVSRVKGVGRVQNFGSQHAMRIWLDPSSMFNYKVTAPEVVSAIRSQNLQLAAGQLGGAPAVEGTQVNATIMSQTLMETPGEFSDIILRTLPDGSSVKLGDVAKIEVGAENYGSIRRFNRKAAAGFGISLASGANALETIQGVKDRIEQIRPNFPKDMRVSYPVDVSPFIKTSMWEVGRTLGLALILVLAVMYLFLQSGRATLIPGVAIPVVLLGTLAALSVLGYSINILTMFALVLSIGMLVDDAIVVTENVKSSLENNGEDGAKEAAKKSMKELTGALIGTTVVIWAVFTPMTFFSGSTGVIYRQFSVTILCSMTISLFMALTFAPSLAGSLLKGNGKSSKLFGWFNKGYDKVAKGYDSAVKWTLKQWKLAVLVFLGIVAATIFIFLLIPEEFLPNEDQGRLITIVQGPPGASFDRTMKTVKEVEKFYLDESEDVIADLFTVAGFSFSGQGQNTAIGFSLLRPYEERKEGEASVFSIADKANQKFSQIKDAMVFAVVPPPISQLGNASGFQFRLVDRVGLGHEKLVESKDQLLGLARKNPVITNVRANALEDNPQYKVELDDVKARAMGIPTSVMNNTLAIAWGGLYVNDYIENGRVKRVFLQGQAPYRMTPSDLSLWYAKNDKNEMVSFSDFSTGKWIFGSPQLQRFNGQPAYEIQGEAAPGSSAGEAMKEILSLIKKLPDGIGIEWTGLSYEQRQAQGQVFALYGLSIFAIFLSLAALYESWSIPFSIILVLPLGVFGAALATWLTGQSNDVYFKVGVLLTMGLAAKNAILIVEFARNIRERGVSPKEAAIEACKRRFRPILMTSFTFVLGVLPLAFASGPGSGAQNSIGIGLVGGITSTTLLIIFFSPVFFTGVVSLTNKFGSIDESVDQNVKHPPKNREYNAIKRGPLKEHSKDVEHRGELQ
ncbi:MAG: hydrophobe/amphiphile efflux-1 family RND transporter [Halobacteriovoraceae bacterium]|nr:hydrophobe/amphiphile efflux-1 family RND transporter [Halobacteriovoraceae bacterium]